MPYTFGASQADDVSVNIGQALINSQQNSLVMGWWCPTNIAGTDVLWGTGNVSCAQMVSSTSVKIIADNVTTDGEWTGTLTALSDGVWAFLAFLTSVNNTGPAGAVRMWQGSINTGPAEISVTQTVAPVGNFTGSTTFTIGNKGTSATDAFDGDIGNVVEMFDDAGSGVGPLAIASPGVISQSEADNIARLFIWPTWLGDHAKIAEAGRQLTAGIRPAAFYDLNNGNVYGNGRVNAGAILSTLTVNGATKSVVNGNPRPAISRPGWPLRRR